VDESSSGLGESGFLSDGRVLVGDLELVFDAEVLLVNGLGKTRHKIYLVSILVIYR